MSLSDRKTCFVTLAVGKKYRDHALTLAEYIRTITDNTPFVVLTDRPEVFPKSDSLIPIPHRIQSVGVYHDKLDCIAASFRLGFDDCIFLDADCRILQNATISRQWKIRLTAKSCYDLHKNLLRRESRETGIGDFLEKIACRYGIQIEGCKFINEWIFVVCRDGNEDIFPQSWREIRNILERKRTFAGEGAAAISMAVRIAGWSVYHYDTGYPEEAIRHRQIDIYKDKMFIRPESIPGSFQEKYQELELQRKAI
ncbi:hypothetical protein MiAbW_01957 [Microcystis aeruginosa NIES-4325]|uniref:Nucleotide-diphospho-sugar transferase domain-containing protein n=1 Tax=Microcystis aeruginosa NIES-4325 TaxID=2569534 RepID=A0A5J4F9S0_MICAE|nr:hypothetical protein [Microcystis aeruginosa]GEA27394.1 hypothetical protein MiAbW_01957 [Microcystis aeruginosa NIES-4325]